MPNSWESIISKGVARNNKFYENLLLLNKIIRIKLIKRSNFDIFSYEDKRGYEAWFSWPNVSTHKKGDKFKKSELRHVRIMDYSIF